MKCFQSAAPVAVILFSLFSLGCSGGGEAGPAVGSPAWYWAAAVENYDTGDFNKAVEHLDSILKDDQSEFAQRAAIWRAVLLIGIGKAHMDVADAYDAGIKESGALAKELTVPIQENRRLARKAAIDLTESMTKLIKIIGDADSVPVQFPFPTGSPSEPPTFDSIRDGQSIPANQRATAEEMMRKRGVLLAATEMVGSGDAVNTAKAKFEAGPVPTPRVEMMHYLGKSLYELSELFDRQRLNEPNVRKVMLNVSLGCIEPLLESENEDLKKSAEELKKEIEADQKQIKA